MPSRPQNVLSKSGSENVFSSSSARTFAFKTPARSQKHGRTVHDENAVHCHPKTTGLTERKKTHSVAFDTQFSKPLKTDQIARTANKATALSEITNKTPFKVYQSPITHAPPSASKLSKLFVVDDNEASARRISSSRKKLRLPRSTTKNFQTPETMGNYWDVSDISIEAVVEEASETVEDDDDVEYCAPSAMDSGFDPSFELPDYKEVGATLMSLFRWTTVLEGYEPKVDDTELLGDLAALKWDERIELREIPPDDIFPNLDQSVSQLATANRRNNHPGVREINANRETAHQSNTKSTVRFEPQANARNTPPISRSLSEKRNLNPAYQGNATLPLKPKSAGTIPRMTPHVTSSIKDSQSRHPAFSHLRAASLSNPGTASKPQSRGLAFSHTRAASDSSPGITRIPQSHGLVSSRLKASSVSRPVTTSSSQFRGPAVSRPRAPDVRGTTSTLQARGGTLSHQRSSSVSRSGIQSIMPSRSAAVSKSLLRATPQSVQQPHVILEETIKSLVVASNDDILGEEFLFDV